MGTLLIALAAGIGFIVAYHTYGRWLGSKIFRLSADAVCPSERLNDGVDYVPTSKSVVFGHHFTSIAGTGPIVGPAIAIMWGWLPALLWVVFGSIFIGAVHDFGALVVSLRNNGQTVGDIAGRVLNKRVRLLFLFTLFMALTVVLAIFGLVIAAVFDLYPSAIFPCLVQIPIAIAIGMLLHRQGIGLFLPSLIALGVMYLTVVFGDWGSQHGDHLAVHLHSPVPDDSLAGSPRSDPGLGQKFLQAYHQHKQSGHGTGVRCPTGNRESQRAKTRDIEAIFAGRGLFRSLRLAKARHAIPFLPLVALLEHRHSLVPFEYVALGAQIR